jgi:hypothetical protein
VKHSTTGTKGTPPRRGWRYRSRELGTKQAIATLALMPAPVLPASALLAIWLILVPSSGGYFERDWAPAALASVGLLAAVVVGGRSILPKPRSATVAVLLLLAILAWSFGSVAWAGAAGSAWEASNKLMLYVATAWVLALLPWTVRSAALFMAVWAFGITALCVGNLVSALGATDLGSFFIESRYAGPLNYPNGTAALAAMAVLPLLAVVSLSRVPIPVAAAGIAAAAFLAEFALLPQTRAAMLGLLIALAVLLALAPHRLRLATYAGIIAGAVIISGPALLAVDSAVQQHHPVIPRLERAGETIGLSAAAAGLITVVLRLIERRIPTPGVNAYARRAGTAAVVVGLVIGAGLGAINADRIGDRIQRQWQEFKAGAGPTSAGPRLFTTAPFQRYDYWRVAVGAFADAPVTGLGAGNFERRYTAERRFAKHSRYAHSIWFRLIAEYGVVGAALFTALLSCVLVGALSRWRRGAPGERGVIAAGLAVGVYFLFHASLDWLEEIPALAAPAIGLPFIVLALGTASRPNEVPRGGKRLAAMAAFLAGAAVAAASLVLPYASLRYVERARSEWNNPTAAYRDLDRAAALNSISVEPTLTEGIIAVQAGQSWRARAAFENTLGIEEHWLPHFELALLTASEGRFDAARRELARAERLNAMDPMIEDVRSRVERKERIDPAAINRSILQGTLYERRRLK